MASNPDKHSGPVPNLAGPSSQLVIRVFTPGSRAMTGRPARPEGLP